MAPNGRQSPGHELQTPGAGSSHKPSHSLEIPAPQQARLAAGAAIVRSRTPTRTSTLHEDIEFGVYLRSGADDVGGDSLSQSSRGGVPTGERRSSESIPEPPGELDPHKSFFLANPAWKTDIITFCSHARVDPILGTAHITHIQARKSNRPPFLHEYLLIFFTALDNHRFVMRIDRLGKVISTTSDNFRKGRGTTANAAVQGVGVYHIADSNIDVDSVDGPWLASDGGWGSRPVATLATWESLRTSGTHVSHHITANETSGLHQPKLQDVSRLLEAILLEMPNYHLTTANCYFMTRSSLLLLQRCYPSAFACFLGTTAHQMIPASTLAQPIWAGLLRWYLPFVTLFFLAYVIVLTIAYQQILYIAGCLDYRYIFPNNACHLSRLALAALYALHAILDAPLPIGVMHAYMTSLEVEMNKLVENLSARFADSRGGRTGGASPRPFGVLFEAAWLTALAWCVLGGVGALFVFVSMAFEYGALTVFVLSLVGCIVFNLKLGTSRSGPLPDEQEVDDIFGPIPEI